MVGQPFQPDSAVPRRQRVERGDTKRSLGSLSKLELLYLGNNELSGEIPPELGSLSNLRELVLVGNQLSGCVPSSLEDQLSSSSDLGGLPYC